MTIIDTTQKHTKIDTVTPQLISDAMERIEVLEAMKDNRPSMSLNNYKKSLYV